MRDADHSRGPVLLGSAQDTGRGRFGENHLRGKHLWNKQAHDLAEQVAERNQVNETQR